MIDISHITPQGQAGLEIKHVLAEIIDALDGGGTGGDGITGIIVDGSSLPIDSGNVTLGNASLLSTGSDEGDVVVLSSDGKIDSALLPSISITDTVVCSDESITTEEELKTWAEGQGLEQGDMIIVSNGTDLTGTYVVLSDGSLQAISTPSASGITGITINGYAVSVDNGVASIVDVVFTDDLKDFVTGEEVDNKIASATAGVVKAITLADIEQQHTPEDGIVNLPKAEASGTGFGVVRLALDWDDTGTDAVMNAESILKKINESIPSLDGYATKEYVDEQVNDISDDIKQTIESIEEDIDTKTSTLATKEEVKEVEEKIPDVSSFITEATVDTKLADYAKKTDIADFITAEAVAETYATKEEIPDVSKFITEDALADYVKIETLSDYLTTAAFDEAKKDFITTDILDSYLTIEKAEETYATKAEIPDVSNFTTQYISTGESSYEYVVNRISNADGTIYGEIFNELDGGGARFMNTETKLKGFVGVNDGTDGMYAQIYALNNETKEGTRINAYQDMICYSSKATSAAGVYSAENEIAVKGDIAEAVAALEEKIAELENAIKELQGE